MKLVLGMEVGFSPGDFVLDKGAEFPSPIFGPFLFWPNGWMDQDATWYGCRPQPRGLCVRWRPSPPPQKGGGAPPPKFSAHIYCGQMAGWIKMPLGMGVGFSPGDFVLDGDPAPLPKNGSGAPSSIVGLCLLRPNGWMDQDATWYGGRPRPTRHCVRWGPAPPSLKGQSPQFSANVRCDQTAGWTKM